MRTGEAMIEKILLVVAVIVMFAGMAYVANYIDTHGGLKSVSERIWNGEP